MKRLVFLVLLVLTAGRTRAQELFVNTEPASNMAAGAIGFRLTNEIRPVSARTAFRTSPEVMIGFSRHLMVHASLYGSTYYQSGFQAEGLSFYGKYRILALDQAQQHFRIAAYGRVSLIRNTINFREINLQGDNSGFMGGLVFTQLIHKLALSATTDLSHAVNNTDHIFPSAYSRNQFGYTLSAGYLLLPRSYTDYKQTNVNLYAELLGKSGFRGGGNYLDIAPALQFIFNSTTRLDFSYQRQLTGNLTRLSRETFLIRLEYNIFNAL